MAKLVDVGSIGSYFQSLEDPRHIRNRRHRLVDVLVVAVAGILCGAEGPTAIHRWAKARADWLSRFLSLPNGVPSRDCIRRCLMLVRPEAFQQCFLEWTASIQPAGGERLVAIDGKTCRGSHRRCDGVGPLHIVSAWAGEEGLALGQVAVEEKSGEATAIPELLGRLDLRGTIVTIDAAGCNAAIAEQIVSEGGDFVLAVKDNQPKLNAAIEAHFEEQIERDFEEMRYGVHETTDEGRGRLDERAYYVTPVPKGAPFDAWPQVKAVGYAIRLTTFDDGRETCDVRHYILSRELSGKRFAEAVRGHWSIESMHWVLDVTFREDDSRTRERRLADNLSWLRRFATGLLKKHPDDDSIRGKMQRCGWSTEFLEEVLTLSAL